MMSMLLGDKLRELRKSKGLSQEQLAEAFGLSVQAVSKWECSLSHPDILLLPAIADFFHVTIDELLRDAPATPQQSTLPLPDDGVLRVVQCRGGRILSRNEYDPAIRIPLKVEKASGGPVLQVEIWGSADIQGDITGDINAGDSINCGNVDGTINAGDSVRCGNVDGAVNVGDGVTCGNVEGEVNAGDSVNCGNVSGAVNAGDSVTCGNVGGDANAGDGICCNDIHGNIVSCNGDVHCAKVEGSIRCEGDVYIQPLH